MLSTGFLVFSLLSGSARAAYTQASTQAVRRIVKDVAESGRCTTIAESPDERVAPPPTLPPGPPPLLSFRYYESKAHHPVGTLGLMLDDAGH